MITIQKKWGVPLYWCDENNPKIFIQELNGLQKRGQFINKQFVEEPTDAR